MKSYIKILLLNFLFVLPQFAIGQATDVVVQGSITDSKTGETLIAVNVVEMDANGRIVNATITDFNGHYVMKVKNTANKLSFTFIGFKAQELEVGSKRIINLEMEENVQVLEEAVVTAEKMHREGCLCYSSKRDLDCCTNHQYRRF